MSEKHRRVCENATIIGQNLKTLRLMNDYSQREIAHKLGVSFQQVQKYEKGHNRVPIEKIFKLKKLYDVPYDIFFQGLAGEENEKALADKYAYRCFLEINACPDPAFQKRVYKAVSALLN